MKETSTASNPCIYRYTRKNKRKELRTGHYNDIRKRAKDEYRGGNVQAAEDKLSKTSCISVDKDKFIEYLKVRAEVAPILRDFYENHLTDPTIPRQKRAQRKNAGATDTSSALPAPPPAPVVKQPLHRKLRLSAYINQQQADERLVRNICKKFGENPVLVMGDWSAPMARFHEPIKGIGMRRMLRKHGLEVVLIDEFKTSSICPKCE
ncbi:hypothetical protein H4R20_007264, partial [Coemansia guatemalensis]